jgi:hypothetical protein
MTRPLVRQRASTVRTRDHLRVGRPDVELTASAHTSGNREGNALGSYEKMHGHHHDGTSDARRSTGIAADKENPILPGMPNLSPA